MTTTSQAIPTTARVPLGERAREWWRVTVSDAAGDRGIRAQLRRARTPLDAVSIPAAIGLARRLGSVATPDAPPWKQQAFERALGLAIVLAHVTADSETSLLRVLGWGQFPYDKAEAEVTEGRPILSELRFRRFLQTDGEEELIAAFARLVRLAKGAVDVADLSRAFLRWNDDSTKRDLALTYFRADARGLNGHD
jgi:CRISPR type I-E-associated protein CasB/Cse2